MSCKMQVVSSGVRIYIDYIREAAEDCFGPNCLWTNHLPMDLTFSLLDFSSRAKRAKFENETFHCRICLEPKQGLHFRDSLSAVMQTAYNFSRTSSIPVQWREMSTTLSVRFLIATTLRGAYGSGHKIARQTQVTFFEYLYPKSKSNNP